MVAQRRCWRRFLLVGLLSAWGGCGPQTEEGQEVAEPELGQLAAELSQSSQSYVVLRRDVRRCASPYCGGFYVRDANRTTAELYVTDLDLRYAGLDAATQALVRGAPAQELVLRGVVSARSPSTGLRRFIVTEAYRGMPGAVVRAGDVLYKARPYSPQPLCFTAPCPSEHGWALNTSTDVEAPFSSYAMDGAARAGVELAWLRDRVRGHGAITAGRMRDGTVFAGGPEQVLEASQVFVRLPDPPGPCSAADVTGGLCLPSTLPTYARSEDRCFVFQACEAQQMCTLSLPACESGYRLVTYRTAGACTTGVCEPEFVQP